MGKIDLVTKRMMTLLLTSFVFAGTAVGVQVIRDVNIESEVDDEKETNNKNMIIEENVKTVVQAQNIKKEYVKVVSKTNVRNGTNVECDAIGIVKKGSCLEVTDTINNEWYEVKYEDTLGYIQKTKAYITDDKDINQFAYLKSEYIDSRTKDTLPQYETVEILREEGQSFITLYNKNIVRIPKDKLQILDGTYVVVDISDQELKLYEDNKVILTSPVITGRQSSPTTEGIYDIYEITRNRDLIGPNYRSYVNVMMKFNRNQGLHDAEYHTDENGKRHGWRNISEFGGDTYLYHGSHGCVNMPHDSAIEVSNHVKLKDKVLVKK